MNANFAFEAALEMNKIKFIRMKIKTLKLA